MSFVPMEFLTVGFFVVLAGPGQRFTGKHFHGRTNGRGQCRHGGLSVLMWVIPAWPESPFCAAPAWPGPTGRIAASLCPTEFPKIGAAPGKAGKHVGHTSREVAWRSKPEGSVPTRSGPLRR